MRLNSIHFESCAALRLLRPQSHTQSVPRVAFGCTLLAFGSHEAGSAGGVVASMVVSQTADPGSIPGRRKAVTLNSFGFFYRPCLLSKHPTEL